MGENVQRIPVADASLCSNARGLFHEWRVPCRGQTERNRKFGAESVDYIEAEEDRNVQPRLFDRYVLIGVGLWPSRC